LVVAISLTATLGACGGADNERVNDASIEKAAIQSTIDDFYIAFSHAEGARACVLLTPDLRRRFVAIAVSALPSLKGKPCGRVFLGFYKRVSPEDAPRAITQAAGDAGPPMIKLEGEKATASYKSGGEIRLQKLHGKWLIAAAELLPRRLQDEHDYMPASNSRRALSWSR
jgi:hypothetical protein